ncbi:MAG: hypothetical protein M1818_003385 [Claussenomyces sp. TS43310]|nr:MAG: hypothetical protein M1818_003385 [Claussenomyces sp. TS43310]
MDTENLGTPDDIQSQPRMTAIVEKRTIESATFGKLPDEIIEQILRICDPSCFASLVLLNSRWRRVSQQAHLYGHHLSRCSSFTTGCQDLPSGSARGDELPLLRRLFKLEMKRHLSEAYLRPRETVISLKSTSISSSAAFPGGEAFHFSFSPSGHQLLGYSSSRIYVIDMTDSDPVVKRELKILRRPASTTILDDGSLLAVLSTDHQVNVYELAAGNPRHIRAVALDHAPRTIALSPNGSVLAAAYLGGIEVYPLSSAALMADRRAVKCDAVDSLSFSQDGTQLLGTTIQSKNPSTVILTAPYYDPLETPAEDATSQLWTTSILFPNSTRDCSHAVLLPSPLDEETSWTFTYDRIFETFRAVRVDDLRNGTTYFTGPVRDADSTVELLPSTLPATTSSGDVVSAGFQGKEIWIYGVPKNLDTPSENTQSIPNNGDETEISVARMNSQGSSRSINHSHNSSRTPQWQLLSDKSRNKFVEGRKVGRLDGVSAVKWVTRSTDTTYRERLIAVAPGILRQHTEFEEDGIPPVDGGRISILDFDYCIEDGQRRILTIEVGDNEPEILEEEHRDLEAEVAIVRRRTVAQRRSGTTNMLRSTTVDANMPPSIPGRTSTIGDTPAKSAVPLLSTTNMAPVASVDQRSEGTSIDEDGESLDAPYAHDGPRSGGTLRRAATAAAISRQMHLPRSIAPEQIVYRRADGREEHPHESDADDWVPPPPPYTKDALDPLPEHLRDALTAATLPVVSTSGLHRSATQKTSGSGDSDIIHSLQRSRTTFAPQGDARRSQFADATAIRNSTFIPAALNDDLSERSVSPEDDVSHAEFDDVYDVSPPGTPKPERAENSAMTSDYHEPSQPAPPTISRDVSPQSSSSAMHRNYTASGIPPSDPPIALDTVKDDFAAGPKVSDEKLPALEPVHPLLVTRHLTKARLDAPVPSRPTEDHRLSDVPPSTLMCSVRALEDYSAVAALPRPSNTPNETRLAAPVEHGPSEAHAVNGYSRPSNAQLARLSSRFGRPPSRLLTDPSRRVSGGSEPAQPGIRHRSESSIMRDYPQHTDIAARITRSDAQKSVPASDDPRTHEQSAQPMDASGRISAGPARYGASTPNLRPKPNRLETIMSIPSQGEAAAIMQRTRSQSSITRRGDRSGQNSSTRLQHDRQSRWMGNVRKRRDRRNGREGAEAPEWAGSSREGLEREQGQKDKKCIIM